MVSAYTLVTFGLNIHIAAIFAVKLIQMRTPFRRSTKVLRRILIYSFFSNTSIGIFAITVAVAWLHRNDLWFLIPLELLGKSYPTVMVLALLAREDARKEMNSFQRGSDRPLPVDMELDFLDPVARRRYSAEISEPIPCEEPVSKFIWYRPNAMRRTVSG